MDVKYINPFLEASVGVIKSFCNIDAKIGVLNTKPLKFEETDKVILIGVTGQVKGQVLIAFNNKTACKTVSSMVGADVSEIDSMGESALSELGNMIMGNTSTIFSNRGIGIDITPPTLATGKIKFDISSMGHLCIPIDVGESEIDMHVALKI